MRWIRQGKIPQLCVGTFSEGSRYIHANYRFIVDPQGSYEHLVSVDDHLDWKDVLQVLVSSKSQSTNCPICLSDPVGPRMAKCGHIFCLPCLIRYMHSTEDSNPISEKRVRWKKCPICEDSIYISEARPVRWFVGQEGDPPHEGSDIVLRLMRRDGDSGLALPRENNDSATFGQDIPWYFAAEVMDYARIMKGSADYMQSQYDEEIIKIETQGKEDELLFEEDNQWTQKAITSIREAAEKVKSIGNHLPTPSFKSLEKRPMFGRVQTLGDPTHAGKICNTSQSSRHDSMLPSEIQQASTTIASPDKGLHLEPGNKRFSQDVNQSDLPATTFFFYQALLHYYLAPLDIRILKTAFGDYSMFPSAVLARVEHVSTGHIVDDDLRKRTKYLGHLPHGCEVGFLECDWTDIVPAEILQRFSADLDRRRKRNKDKETREEKERIRAEKEEDDKRWASIRRRRDNTFHQHDTSSFTGIPESSTLNLDRLNLGTSASPPWTRGGSGFASLVSPSTSPGGPKTVWGTNVVPLIESPPLTAERLPLGPENDGWLQGWEQDLMHEDELSVPDQTGAYNDSTSLPNHGGKKKKNKKITLMSTNARRAA